MAGAAVSGGRGPGSPATGPVSSEIGSGHRAGWVMELVMDPSSINWLAVLAAALSSFLIGGLW
jgi:hypothetical protein